MPLNMRNSTQIRFHCAGALVLAPQVQTNPSDQSITHSLTRALVASLRLLAHPKNKSHTHISQALWRPFISRTAATAVDDRLARLENY